MADQAEADGRRRGGNRRAQILDAALKLFAQKGMAQVTTRQIAQAVGISQPSLYAHFRSADEIAAELCVRAFAALAEAMARVVAVPAGSDERLRRMARAYIDFALAQPDMYRVAFMLEDPQGCKSLGAADGLSHDPVLEAGLLCFAQWHRVIVEHVGDDDERAMILAQSTWAHIHGLVSLLIARHEFPWADRERLIEEHLRRLSF
ncbi:TetR/AcrR family transcriptional regulator [Novosphingobium piscinae]|uniref:TetR/AcrR family transcriptional regulator n=2 Tax=Novosphingobium piscinae TaxID=1507448 RepID=A0A7X1FXU1_9SPHN|nr:TetR/AcrR family transcriptional regulator [Novosphingobium piscinae]